MKKKSKRVASSTILKLKETKLRNISEPKYATQQTICNSDQTRIFPFAFHSQINTNDYYKIVDFNRTKWGKFEYVGLGSESNKKFFTRKMVLQSQEIFVSVLHFYQGQVKKMFSRENRLKQDSFNI